MNTAARVRERKERLPECYCPNPRCLWLVKHNGHSDTPCPKHMRLPQIEMPLEGQ